MSGPELASLAPGAALPERTHAPDNVQLFLYNAALWNAHRIHYDVPYASDVEGYDGLVIAGPLMGDWLAQCVETWLGDAGRIVQLSYSNRQTALVGETLTAGGEVTAVDPSRGEATVDLWVKNEAGDVITPGSARVAWTS